ncbi:DNA polymerase III beta subunit DnaN [Gammaproteobacteria bacterium]|nr:DNA polymerase III beta subunit DnaN [Gammaproteobacteria bacterium]
MKLSIQREQLLQPLQAITGVINSKNTLQILLNVRVIASEDEILLTATDIDNELSCSFPHIALETGEITLPAKKMQDILQALPEGSTVNIEIEGTRALIKCGRSKFTLQCLPTDEFPVLDDIEFTTNVTLPKKDLRKILEDVKQTMAVSDVRYFLNGLLLNIDGNNVTAIATDGHKLGASSIELTEGDYEPVEVIIPRKGVFELIKLLNNEASPVNLQISKNYLKVESLGLSFTTKLIEGRFPDYRTVIPRPGEKVIFAGRVELIKALERSCILLSEKSTGIKINVSQFQLRLSTHNKEQEETEEIVEINYQGEEFSVSFNISYLIDILKVFDTEMIRINMADPNASALIRTIEDDDKLRFVIMPMRI